MRDELSNKYHQRLNLPLERCSLTSFNQSSDRRVRNVTLLIFLLITYFDIYKVRVHNWINNIFNGLAFLCSCFQSLGALDFWFPCVRSWTVCHVARLIYMRSISCTAISHCQIPRISLVCSRAPFLVS